MSYIEEINNLFESDIKTSEIAKDTGLSHQYITNYRLGVSKIKNMQLEKAEILIKYINDLKK